MPNLAPTTFQTGIQDDLAAVDAYTQTSASDPIDTSATDNSDPNDVAGFLGLDSAAASSDASSALSSLTSSTSSKDALSAITDSMPDLQSPLSDLDPDIQKQLTAFTSNTPTLSTITDGTTPGMPSVTTALSAKNVTSLSAMLDVVGKQSSGGLSVTPTGVQASFMSNLLKLSVGSGIPNAYARIDAGGLGSSVMTAVTKTALSVAVSTSNMNLLANVSNGSMATSVKGMSPSFLSDFASNFKLSANVSPSGQAQLGADISSAFGKIDASWSGKTNGAGNTLVNANLFANGSSDFQTVMKAAVTFSRTPLATTTTVNANLAANLVPTLIGLPPGTVARSAPSAYGQTQSFTYGSGEVHTYVPNQDGTYNQTIVAPAVPTTNQLSSLNNSAITDPLALTGLYGQCLANGSSASTTNGLPDPTLDAAASLAQTFPLAYTGPLMNLG